MSKFGTDSPLSTLARCIPNQALAVALDPAGRVAADLPCRKCGYNLRGQLAEGICPECATPVGRALQGDYLKFADPTWLESLASGMNWILAGVVAGMITGGGIGGSALCLSRGITWVPLLMVPIGLIGVIGYWKVTTPDPSGIGEGQGVSARQLTRVTQPINYLCSSLQMLSAMSAVSILVHIATLVNVIVGAVNTFASLKYSRQLALRIPDPKMARGFRIVMWGMVAGLILFVVGTIAAGVLTARSASAVMLTTMPTTGPGTSSVAIYSVTGPPVRGRAVVTSAPVVFTGGSALYPAFAVLGCMAPVFVGVFGIWLMVLFFRLRRALINAAADARATWASSVDAPANT